MSGFFVEYEKLCNDLKSKIPGLGDYSFKGMIPIVNSAILRSDKFHKSEYKSLILICIFTANSFLLSSVYSQVIAKPFSMILGSIIGGLVTNIMFNCFILLYIGLFLYTFIKYYQQHNQEIPQTTNSQEQSDDVTGVNNEPLSKVAETEGVIYKTLKSTINDLSILHACGTLFIPYVLGTFVDVLMMHGRQFFHYQKNDFKLDEAVITQVNASERA